MHKNGLGDTSGLDIREMPQLSIARLACKKYLVMKGATAFQRQSSISGSARHLGGLSGAVSGGLEH